MTHETVRDLLPGYAAGVLSDAHSDLVRAHLAGGCLACFEDVFSRPVGLPIPPSAAPPSPVVPARPRRVGDGRVVIVAVAILLCSIAVAVSMIADRNRPAVMPAEDAARLARDLDEAQEMRTALASRLALLERAAASADRMSREAEDVRASMEDLQRDLDAARLRIGSLKRALRRQDSDFREKQQSLEAVIASLSRRIPAAGAAGSQAGETACDRVAEPARGVCTAFCRANECDRTPGPDCEPLRAKYEELTGARVPPCAVAIGSHTLTPCDTSHVDVWSFAAKEGRRYTISADTVEPGTEADLCLVGSCQGSDTFAGDDETACRSAPGEGCPRATFLAPADASCIVAVTICSPGCGARDAAPYELTIEGAYSVARLADGVSTAAAEPDDETD